MSYSCLEELQVDLDLHALDKIYVLSKAGRKYDDEWLVVTDDGVCHLFDKDGNLDDIKKVTCLNENHIRRNITKIVIPDSVTSIRACAFEDCSGLTSVTIGAGVKSIWASAFEDCLELTKVTIPDSVMSIGNYAFSWCNSLTNVTIGNGMTNIRNCAFYNCDKLTNLTFKGKTLEQVKKMNYYPWGIIDDSIIQVG